ncbi:MAG: hypothetical protein R8F63_21365 [Acidimicrobiales bacterium]|nr:hypothetical protein [Acidimicrobiales bacterium]
MVRRHFLAVAVAVALIATACGDTDDPPTAEPDPSVTSTTTSTSTTPPTTGVIADRPASGTCDTADAADCLLPWPSDRFTRIDDTTATGLRVDLPSSPANADGVPIDVTEWNRNDGFSPAAIPMVVIPDLDPAASSLPPVTDIGASLDDDSTLVLLDVDTGERVPAWAELDQDDHAPGEAPVFIVPAVALTEGHRHIVALRDLVTIDGEPAAVAGYLEQLAAPDTITASLIDGLAEAGFDAEDMTVAWTFTVASADSLSGRLRHMWAETSAEIGDGAVPFEITSTEASGSGIVINGTFETPNYLTGDGSTGSVMNNDGDPDGIPTRNGSLTTEFVCTMPAAASADNPAPVVLYGHGLLGSRGEALGIGSVGATAGIGFCAIDWIGMSTADVGTVIDALGELSAFRSQPDRMQQGHLAWLVLGRLLAGEDGFVTDPAFQDATGGGTIAHDRLSFLGASQGGILAGAPSALASDWTQVILAVPGLGYNLLLPRSIDFDEFSPLFEGSYPDPLDRGLAREMMEMLWDRGENAGWAQHLTTDPYDGAPAKNVLILAAFGDHQVANVSTDKLARTLGIGRVAPTLADGRSTDVEPFVLIDPIDSLPHQGSGYLMWDFGTPAPPTDNIPPRAGEDPHGKLADVPAALAIVAAFIEPDGAIIDACAGQPCQTLE